MIYLYQMSKERKMRNLWSKKGFYYRLGAEDCRWGDPHGPCHIRLAKFVLAVAIAHPQARTHSENERPWFSCKKRMFCNAWHKSVRLNPINRQISRIFLNQSINQSIKQSVNQSINQSIKQTINQSINRSIDRINQPFIQWNKKTR